LHRAGSTRATVSIDGVIPSVAARIATRVPGGVARVTGGLLAAALATSALTVPSAAAGSAMPRAVEEEIEEAPLAVSIESLTPSTVPRSGTVTVTGEITNRSESVWTDLKVYLFASAEPMTTSEELEEATATPETLEVGGRITAPGLYDEVEDLAPGESTSYTLSVPRGELPFDRAGVYWLGVHVLGTNEEGRLEGADGRARTFIASMAPGGPRTSLAVVVPLREEVARRSDGRLVRVGAWNRLLGEDGRLARLLGLARTGSGVPLTWVVDPAVLEAARSLAEGNPAFDLAPTDEPTPDEPTPEESPSPEDIVTESPGPVDGGGSDDPSDEVSRVAAEAQQAADWLTDFTDLGRQQTVLTLPYGDVDVATLLRGEFGDTYDRAVELGSLTMADLDLDTRPVVAPPDGLLPNAALWKLDPRTSLMLSEGAVDTEATKVRLSRGHEAIVSSDVARVGGPTPTPAFDALALRQRILGEAAVHALSETTSQPLVVPVPERWNPGADWEDAAFFDGLDVPWLRLVDVPYAAAVSAADDHEGSLAYPRRARRSEIPVANVLATQELNVAGSILSDLLTRNDSVDEEVGRAAMLGSSTTARSRPHRALVRTRGISEEVHNRLRRVYVEGSPLVTMSSETGNFSVTVINGLREPVTVGIDVETGSEDLAIRAPDLVSLGPGQRASVRLTAVATGTGVHSVRIVPTTEDGRPLGRSTRVKVRSSQVGLVIWLIMGTGGIVFVAAIGARIVRRVRPRQEEKEPDLEDVTT
jgi:hypothetical protein